MSPNKALLIGDYTAHYHTLNGIEDVLKDILSPVTEIKCTDDYSLLAKSLEEYSLFISYTDCWEKKVSGADLSGLLSFVTGGGGLLVIHNGISLQSSFEFSQMVGAKFTGHPPYRELDFKISDENHPIVNGLDGFSMGEEPYGYEFDNFSEKTILFTYNLDGEDKPAAWALPFGLGRVVYLQPGDNIDSFKNPVYREIILRSAKWALKII